MNKTIYIGDAKGSKKFNDTLKQIKRFTKASDSESIKQALEYFLNSLKKDKK